MTLKRRMGIIAVVLLALIAIGIMFVRRGMQHVPDFYQTALAVDSQTNDQQGQRLERAALALHNQVRHVGRWEIKLTDAEINGWLAADLASKLPKLLPPEVADPRVRIINEQVEIGFRYRGKISAVVSLRLHVSVTQSQNEVAFRLDDARVGSLPLPVGSLIEQATQAASRAGVDLRWSEENSRPVALIRMAPRHPEFPKQAISLASIQLNNHEVAAFGVVNEP